MRTSPGWSQMIVPLAPKRQLRELTGSISHVFAPILSHLRRNQEGTEDFIAGCFRKVIADVSVSIFVFCVVRIF